MTASMFISIESPEMTPDRVMSNKAMAPGPPHCNTNGRKS
jgi:hypothetical protein